MFVPGWIIGSDVTLNLKSLARVRSCNAFAPGLIAIKSTGLRVQRLN